MGQNDFRRTSRRRFTAAGTWVALASLMTQQTVLASQPQNARPSLVIPTLAPKPGESIGQVDVTKLQDFDRNLEELRARFDASGGTRDWATLIELGRLELAQARYEAAAVQFENARAIASDPKQRVESAYRMGVTLLMSGRNLLDSLDEVKDPARREAQRLQAKSTIRRAGQTLNDTQRQAPKSREIAMARVDAWRTLGDQLETQSALFQLATIDPKIQADEKFDPATLTIVVVVLIAGSFIVQHFDLGLQPEKRAQIVIVLDILAGFAATGAGPVGVAGAGLYFGAGPGIEPFNKK